MDSQLKCISTESARYTTLWFCTCSERGWSWATFVFPFVYSAQVHIICMHLGLWNKWSTRRACAFCERDNYTPAKKWAHAETTERGFLCPLWRGGCKSITQCSEEIESGIYLCKVRICAHDIRIYNVMITLEGFSLNYTRGKQICSGKSERGFNDSEFNLDAK